LVNGRRSKTRRLIRDRNRSIAEVRAAIVARAAIPRQRKPKERGGSDYNLKMGDDLSFGVDRRRVFGFTDISARVSRSLLASFYVFVVISGPG